MVNFDKKIIDWLDNIKIVDFQWESDPLILDEISLIIRNDKGENLHISVYNDGISNPYATLHTGKYNFSGDIDVSILDRIRILWESYDIWTEEYREKEIDMNDRYYLARFKNAQDFGVYENALAEIRSGRKMSHCMWFVFPQIVGLGHSHNTKFYSIKSADEARAYLEDELLSNRLKEICEALLELPNTDPCEVLGSPDWMKLGSSMTLFDYVSPNDVFAKVLNKYFAGSRDLRSLTIIRNIGK